MEKPTDFFTPQAPVDPIAAYTADPAETPVTPDSASPAQGAPSEPTVTTQEAAPAPLDTAAIEQRAAEAERQAREAQDRLANYERQEAIRAAQAWKDAEVQMHRDLPNMDPDEAIRVQRDFYEQQRQFLIGSNQAAQNQVRAMQLHGFADQVIREHGLNETDRTRLLFAGQANPNLMIEEAKAIVSERAQPLTEIAQLRQQLETLTRQMQANQVVQSGAFRTGGNNAPAAPAPKPKPGSQEQLLSLVPELAQYTQRTG